MRYPKGRRAPKYDGKSELTVLWAHEPGEDNQLTYFWRNSDDNAGTATSTRRDTGILMDHFERDKGRFGRTLKEELEYRGYDISTFKFTIEKLKP
ncbi:hypothetical protein phiK7B1_118 [Pseudomonas phage phiK7B1]|nr:hypothetical protein phiK7B1_118 [Pseudomonas phage phiK7B1]